MKTSPDPGTLPEFYKGYVNRVAHLDVLEALRNSGLDSYNFYRTIPEELGTYRYASGKWSIKELINHIIDGERIFAYRALRFSRFDETPLSGFDENLYAPRANAHARTLLQLAEELKNLRISTVDLFSGFTSEMLQSTGMANNNLISVINIGYVIAGHEMHHRSIVQERYLKK
jgi:hypothetical protein